MNSSANSTSTATATVSAVNPFVTLAFQRLCWKESRQIAPLAIALLSINFLLHILPISSDRLELQAVHRTLLLLIPCLFAVGAGALLISQEKEQRTIGWLSSLPISSNQILFAKLIVSLLGLAITWFACLLLTFVFDFKSITLTAQTYIPFPLAITVVNSVFLLCLGFATAWRWQTPLVALVMIVPLAAFPTFFIVATQSLSPENRISDFLSGVTYVFLSGAFLWYGWRSGQAFLTSKPEYRLWQSLSRSFERRGSRGNLLGAQPQGLASTLLWQFSTQNRMIPIAVAATIILPLIAYVFQVPLKDNPIIPIAAWLIVSWLGASVFQSDSVHQRIKFLAERGVAPRTIWWTRQIIPMGIVLIGTAIAAVLTRNIIEKIYTPNLSFPLVLFAFPAVLVAHAVAQWLGQLVRSPIVSLIVAPAVTLGGVGYLVFAVTTLGAPFWMVFVPIVIAFAATRVMTEPWMDDRTGLKYWLGHIGFLVSAAGILGVPLLVTAMTYPGMPSSVYQSFQAESKKHQIYQDPFELVLAQNEIDVPAYGRDGGMGDGGGGLGLDGGEAIAALDERDPQPPVLGFAEQIAQNVAAIEAQLASRPGAFRWSRAISFLIAEAMLTRAQLDIEPTNEASRERYRKAMKMLNEAVARLRLSWRLIDQDFADRLERWMVEQAQLKDARETFGESNWTTITRTLADNSARMEARRRAIVMSWASAERSTNGQLELGGIPIDSVSGLPGWRGQIADRRRVLRLSWLLLQYLESKDQSEADARFAAVASAWGLIANRHRYQGLSLEAGWHIPGQSWLGDWENYRQ